MSRLRWSRWFWQDWERDNALAVCSIAAQGLWMRLLCIASQGHDYGSITINGNTPSDHQLAKLVRPALDVRRLRTLIAELERNKVLSRDANGVLFSRRMRAEFESFARQSEHGKQGAATRYAEKPHSQNPTTTKPTTESPLDPPASGGRRAGDHWNGGKGEGKAKMQPIRNGFLATVIADMEAAAAENDEVVVPFPPKLGR